MTQTTKQTEKEYDIQNGAGDGLATVWARSAVAAMKIWRTTLWDKAPLARGVHAVATGNTR